MTTLTSVIRSYTPKVPCLVCRGRTLVGEVGVLSILLPDDADEPLLLWTHLGCFGLARAR